MKGEILQWRIEERHSPGTVQVLDAGEWYVADLKALTARVEELEQENAKLLDEVTARRFTDERTDKLLDELEAENKRLEESLRAFAKGLECKEIDDLMTREPEAFELLGKTMTSMVVDLITENKRLREALDTIHKRIMGYEPDNRIEARFFGELKIIARKALDSKAE